MAMSLRERLLTTMRGGVADRIPWNIYASLLPKTEIGRAMQRKGLSILSGTRVCREVHEGVTIRETRKETSDGPHIRVQIETPAGTLDEEATIDPAYGSRWIRKFFITGPEDYAAAEYYFRHTHVKPDYEGWRIADAAMGDAGVVLHEILPLPILHLYQYWMGAEGMAEGVYLYRDRFEALLDAVERLYHQQVELAAAGPSEVIWFPESISAHVISPQLFQRYCLPVYQRAVPVVRGAGKLTFAHFDGSIRPYLDLLKGIDLNIIEAFTPPPMGDLTVAEAKAAWPDKVIWVNFPGNLYLEPAETIKTYTLELLRTSAPGGRLVIGCTEDFPIQEFEKTFTAMGQAMAEYEGRPW